MATTKKAASAKGSEFHVILGNIKLSAAAEARIQSGIQSVVMSELAGYKPNPDDTPKSPFPWGSTIVIPPIRWPGFIMFRDVVDNGLVKQLNEQALNIRG